MAGLNLMAIVLVSSLVVVALGVSTVVMNTTNPYPNGESANQILNGTIAAIGQQSTCKLNSTLQYTCSKVSLDNSFSTSPNILTFGNWALNILLTFPTFILNGLNQGIGLSTYFLGVFAIIVITAFGFALLSWWMTTWSGRYNNDST